MFIILTNVGEEILTELLSLLHLLWLRSGHMKIHRLVGFLPSAVFHETASTTFDLDATASLLLNVFDVSTTLANHLRT